jgi:hypothetical protein
MEGSEIDAVRALLSSKPRPVGWVQRRERLDEVGSIWPVADDVNLDLVDLDGVHGEWSIAPGSDTTRVLMFFHGGGYCSGSIRSHRRMVTEAGRAARTRTLAVGLSPGTRASLPRGPRGRADGMALPAKSGRRGQAYRRRRRQCGWRDYGGTDQSAARRWGGASRLRVASVAMDGPNHVWRDARD